MSNYLYYVGGLVPVGIASFVYLVRKIREYQWGWVRNRYPLDGRIYIVTGANTGLGFETTKALVARNATVIMGCRSLARANEAILRIRQKTANGNLVVIPLDLSSFESIEAFAAEVLSKYPQFDALINNAGLALKTHQTAANGLELTFATNHLGHFLLTNFLASSIRENSSRVVTVSSALHRKGQINFEMLGKIQTDLPPFKGNNVYYNDSKLANFYFARELYRFGVDSHVLCPGLCYTDFFRDYNPRWYHFILFSPVVWLMLRSAEQGAQNIIFCATENQNTAEKNPMTGYYIASLKQTKSKANFDDVIAKHLWYESRQMCKTLLAPAVAESWTQDFGVVPRQPAVGI